MTFTIRDPITAPENSKGILTPKRDNAGAL